MPRGEIWTARLGPLGAVLGILAFLWLAIGVLSSIPGLPGYTPGNAFISELAKSANPLAYRYDWGLIGGGLLTGLALAALAPGFHTRVARWAAWCGASGGFLIAVVGAAPLRSGLVAIHFSSAILAGALLLLATLFLSLGLRGPEAVPGRTRTLLRWSGRIALGIQVLVLVFSVLYLVVLLARETPGSLSAIYAWDYQTMAVHLGALEFNPLALAEWIGFAIVPFLLLGVSVSRLVDAAPTPEGGSHPEASGVD